MSVYFDTMEAPIAAPLRVIRLESEELRLEILPDIGFKICSLQDKATGFEALFRPAGIQPESNYHYFYQRAFTGADFSQFDSSGIDSCIPTIDACYLPEIGQLFDHGDSWSSVWTVLSNSAEKDNTVRAYIRLASMPLYFSCRATLEGRTLTLDYELKNESKSRLPWMWTIHDLARYEEDAVIETPEPFEYTNVQNEEVWDFDIRRMAEVPQDHTYKFYLNEAVKEGRSRIIYPSQGMVYELEWEAEKFPWFGCWITTGGYKGERNIAMEPSNGYYDSLKRAVENEKVDWIDGFATDHWQVKIHLRPL